MTPTNDPPIVDTIMDPIRPGTRGPAVEDIQKKLLLLGYPLGRTGVDGVFLSETLDAVRAFRRDHGLGDEGVVDGPTWAALVDATLVLGNRTLYLRMPYFHGADVEELQSALTILGFPTVEIDGLFGAYTEGALREFQFNVGLIADGVAGSATIAALERLRHVWSGKDAPVPSAAYASFARGAEALADMHAVLVGVDAAGSSLVHRVINLAYATTEDATISMGDPGDPTPDATRLVVEVHGSVPTDIRLPAVSVADPMHLAARIRTAVAAADGEPPRIAVDLGAPRRPDRRDEQRLAVRLLDALCEAIA